MATADAPYTPSSKVAGTVVVGINSTYRGEQLAQLIDHTDCQVLVSYLGFDFSNPTLGLETALGLYDQGADIIYQVAGRSGEGVLEAAAQRDLYAIGVDSNQDDIQPGHVIVSSLKKVESTTFDPIKSAQNVDFWVFMNVYDVLVRVDKSGTKLEPGLAESWEVSPDGTVYTFKMRDAKFEDGSPITATKWRSGSRSRASNTSRVVSRTGISTLCATSSTQGERTPGRPRNAPTTRSSRSPVTSKGSPIFAAVSCSMSIRK